MAPTPITAIVFGPCHFEHEDTVSVDYCECPEYRLILELVELAPKQSHPIRHRSERQNPLVCPQQRHRLRCCTFRQGCVGVGQNHARRDVFPRVVPGCMRVLVEQRVHQTMQIRGAQFVRKFQSRWDPHFVLLGLS